MPVRESKARANKKYDSTHTTGIYLKLNNNTDKDILGRIASVPNTQGYIKQLIRQDITGSVPVSVPDSSVPVSLSDAAMSILTEQAEKTGKSVPDLIALIVNTHLLRTYSVPENNNESEEKTMKTYHIKPEYLDMWEGGDMPSNPDRIVTEDDIRTLSDAWEKPVEDLLEQLIPID